MKTKYLIIFLCLIAVIFTIIACAGKEIIINSSSENYIFVTQWGSKGEDEGEFLFEPYSPIPFGEITVDSKGYVYVNDWGKKRCIQKFDSNGNFIHKWENKEGKEWVSKVIFEIIVDKEGYIYTLCRKEIYKYDSNGNFIINWKIGMDEALPSKAIAFALSPEGYIFAINDNIIWKFSSEGKVITKWDVAEHVSEWSLNYFKDLIIDPSGFVYMVYAAVPNNGYDIMNGNNYIHMSKYNSSGEFIKDLHFKRGHKDGELLGCSGITIDSKGNIFVIDWTFVKHRIQKFNSELNFITKFGDMGKKDGEFLDPRGIAVDSEGKVYVLDTGNYRIQKFAPVP